ncbi:MAG TPA: hypothetical protein V6C97_19720 [Oculatellaceae cyanobacterium]
MKIFYALFSSLAATVGFRASAFASPLPRFHHESTSPVLISQNIPIASFAVPASPTVVVPAAQTIVNQAAVMPASTYAVSGLQASGVVRVNNQANFEQAINAFGVAGELTMIAFGLWLIVRGVSMAKTSNIVCGVMSIAVGLSLPGCLSWLIAIGRDANLCG